MVAADGTVDQAGHRYISQVSVKCCCWAARGLGYRECIVWGAANMGVARQWPLVRILG